MNGCKCRDGVKAWRTDWSVKKVQKMSMPLWWRSDCLAVVLVAQGHQIKQLGVRGGQGVRRSSGREGRG